MEKRHKLNRKTNPQKKVFVRRKKRGKLKVFLLSFIVFLTMIFTIVMFFKIEKVNVYGNLKYSSAEIIEASKIEFGKNIFLFDKNKAADNISKALPYIGEVIIKRSFPNGLMITVVETKSRTYAKILNKYYILDSFGKILEIVTTKPNLPEIIGTGIEAGDVGKVPKFKDDTTLRIYDSLWEYFIINKIEDTITEVNISKRYNITFDYKAFVMINLGTIENIDLKIKAALVCINDNEIEEKAEIKYQDNTATKTIYRELTDDEWIEIKLNSK